jgi:hypothetical protein
MIGWLLKVRRATIAEYSPSREAIPGVIYTPGIANYSIDKSSD